MVGWMGVFGWVDEEWEEVERTGEGGLYICLCKGERTGMPEDYVEQLTTSKASLKRIDDG